MEKPLLYICGKRASGNASEVLNGLSEMSGIAEWRLP
jgi:hypothetical protein